MKPGGGSSLPLEYKGPRSVAISISIHQGASLLVNWKRVLPTYTHQSIPASVGGIIIEAKPAWKLRGRHYIVYRVARVRFDEQG